MQPLIISTLALGLFAIFVSAKGKKQNKTKHLGMLTKNETKTWVFTQKACTV